MVDDGDMATSLRLHSVMLILCKYGIRLAGCEGVPEGRVCVLPKSIQVRGSSFPGDAPTRLTVKEKGSPAGLTTTSASEVEAGEDDKFRGTGTSYLALAGS
ncbi:hypothetical protein Pcinc_018348 [Petrolisthes cinctipes]|uniref:Uncharacterized protein n=1 Tax=Petrolisthes cinctipes TaxID=88211 RepID=A0AAE1FPI3_PETCI|nr:hypothetical protein Pcinc_018348 [Petrolisthes cinctipes]